MVQVGDASLILEMMAGMLEKLSNIPVMAKTLISTVYRTAQIVASVPNLAYQDKARAHDLCLLHHLFFTPLLWPFKN